MARCADARVASGSRCRDVSPAIVVCWVGKTAAPYARAGIEEYASRIQRYRTLRTLVIAEERGSRGDTARRVEREGDRILERLKGLAPATVIVLDQAGEQIDTAKLAVWVRRHALEEARNLVFVLGGPDGLSSGVLKRADRRLGLSRLTLPHDMARLLLLEQIYRSMTILHGHPYDR